MKKYRVLLRGDGLNYRVGDDLIRGFYCTRIVRASTISIARDLAAERARQDMRRLDPNVDLSQLEISVDTIWEERGWGLFTKKPKGFTFFFCQEQSD